MKQITSEITSLKQIKTLLKENEKEIKRLNKEGHKAYSEAEKLEEKERELKLLYYKLDTENHYNLQKGNCFYAEFRPNKQSFDPNEDSLIIIDSVTEDKVSYRECVTHYCETFCEFYIIKHKNENKFEFMHELREKGYNVIPVQEAQTKLDEWVKIGFSY
ncbi:hypothetical protein [uncultured Clostridium sp.]|uniref:hypothetical protein n=1 Tax=uncultured Clostridium sp. TaxID=59620 RepID=UPI002625DEF3|nr:hypothetical protein [uncultured Clostridium sp.]